MSSVSSVSAVASKLTCAVVSLQSYLSQVQTYESTFDDADLCPGDSVSVAAMHGVSERLMARDFAMALELSFEA